MKFLLATDIFGYTEAIENLKTHFNPLHIIDPYDAKKMSFCNEDEAYNTFHQKCGFESYVDLCREALNLYTNEDVILIGFSMGASAFWKALDGLKNSSVKGFFGFYSSQIRHFLDVKIEVPCSLIFPKWENHFEVDKIIEQLKSNKSVICEKSIYLHGFMNPFSVNYDAQGYQDYVKWLDEKIKFL